MNWRQWSSSGRLVAALGFSCGALVGAVALAVGAVGAAVDATSPEAALRDVLHTPPSLIEQGQPMELRYDVVCQTDSFGSPCTPTGSVFVRQAGELGYRRIALAPAGGTALAASVDVTAHAVAYYAVIDDGAGSSMTVPAAGATAPQRAWAVPALTPVSLGMHTFGRVRQPDGSAVTAAWGERAGALGLLTGRELARIGPSAFDVDRNGTVVVLDQVNDRLARYPARGSAPTYRSIAFAGGEGDLAVAADGTAYVLDQGPEPVVRSYSTSGALAATTRVHGTGADMLRSGPAGTFLHGYPGDMWKPIGGGFGALLKPEQQAAGARPGRLAGGGVEVVVRGGQDEAFVALVRGEEVIRAWRISSATKLGEIQLAEPFGEGMLVVLRVWTPTSAEFVALVLSQSGLAGSFAVDASQWAESAALGRFRLAGKTLYQLRSTPAGVEIVTFDMGGAKCQCREGSRSSRASRQGSRWRWRSPLPAPARTTRTSRARATTSRSRRAA
jgi:hypothetical protein